jgi:hypothetical protein
MQFFKIMQLKFVHLRLCIYPNVDITGDKKNEKS